MQSTSAETRVQAAAFTQLPSAHRVLSKRTSARSSLKSFTSGDAWDVAHQLALDRGCVRKNGNGYKTWCPLCPLRKNPTFSIAARDGLPVFTCHRCCERGPAGEARRLEILHEMIQRGLLQDARRTRTRALATVAAVQRTVAISIWKGTAGANARLVLRALCEISLCCGKEKFSASLFQLGELTNLSPSAVSRALQRLQQKGSLEKVVSASRGARIATSWRIKTPPSRGVIELANSLHAPEECDQSLSLRSPFRGEPGGTLRPAAVTPLQHALFSSIRGGLGSVKGRIYAVLSSSRTSSEIARLLGSKDRHSANPHLRALMKLGIVRRLEDGRYQRTSANLDEIAASRGIFDALNKRRAKYLEQRERERDRCAERGKLRLVPDEAGLTATGEARIRLVRSGTVLRDHPDEIRRALGDPALADELLRMSTESWIARRGSHENAYGADA